MRLWAFKCTSWTVLERIYDRLFLLLALHRHLVFLFFIRIWLDLIGLGTKKPLSFIQKVINFAFVSGVVWGLLWWRLGPS